MKKGLRMKALRYLGPGRAEIDEIPCPTIGPGEVLVQVRACGVCATDVKTFVRGHPKIHPGAVLGHEIAGVVVEADGLPEWRQGNRVVVAPYVPCGACRQCARQHFSLCERLFDVQIDPGGFSQFLRVPARIVGSGLIQIAEGTPFEEGCWAEPLACCLHALESLHIHPGESLLVVGDGPMGLLQAQLGKSMGASPILLSGMTPERLAHASRWADVVIDASREDVAEAVRRETADGADKVIVSVGEASVAQASLGLVCKGGAVSLFAGMPPEARLVLDGNRVHYDEIQVLGSFGFGPQHFRAAVGWIGEGQIDVRSLVTATVPLEGTRAALEAAARHQGIKTVVVFGEGGPM